MKLAIVCDDLVQKGGAEKLIFGILEMWPEATLFAPVISEEWQSVLKNRNVQFKTSFLQKFPNYKKFDKLYAVFFLQILAIEDFNFDEFDVVLSVSARFAHGVVTKPSTIHVCYMNSPGRMIWNIVDYSKNSTLLSMVAFPLRMWDSVASRRPDYFIANSKNVEKRIKKYYRRNSTIIYPFFDLPILSTEIKKENYYLIVSRLQSWKRTEIALDACVKLRENLVVIGDGSQLKNLKRKYSKYSNIKFLGYVSENEKIHYLQKAKALLFTQEEDFGITPVEALSQGAKVIAYKKGGTLETLNASTAVFFSSQNAESLIEAMKSAEHKKFEHNDFQIQASKFTKDRFKESLYGFINDIYLKNKNI